jgi:hypothetical protein
MSAFHINSKFVRGILFAFTTAFASTSIEAQNTHSAHLIRAQQQYFTAADSPSLNFGSGSMTAEAWVKVNAGAADTQDMVILEKRTTGDAAYMLYLANGGALYAEVGNGTSAQAAQTVQIDDGTWHHIAFTYDQSTLRLYLDGVERATQSVSGRDLSSSSHLFIGRSALSNSLHFDGFIDEVRVWSTARSAEEIRTTTFRQLGGTETGLRACWRLNNSQTDHTPSGNVLTSEGPAIFKPTDLPFYDSQTPVFNSVDRHTAGLWHLDGNSVDSSPAGNNGFNYNIQYGNAHGVIGQGARFANPSGGLVQANSYIAAELPNPEGGDFTVSLWANCAELNSFEQFLIQREQSGTAGRPSWHLHVRNAEIWFGCSGSTGSSGQSVTASVSLPTNTWQHIVATREGGIYRIYLNGVNVATETYGSPSICAPTSEGHIGRRYNNKYSGTQHPFNGLLDEILIEKRAMPAEEIRKLYGGIARVEFKADAGDGFLSSTASNWVGARDAALAAEATTTTSSGYGTAGKAGSQTFSVSSFFIPFDTSSLPVSDFNFSHVALKVFMGNDTVGTDGIGVVQSSQTDWNAPVLADFPRRGMLEGAGRLMQRNPNAYQTWELNDIGRNFVAPGTFRTPSSASAAGKTQLALRWGRDLDNAEPSSNDYALFATSESTTPPLLTVEYSKGAPSPLSVSGKVNVPVGVIDPVFVVLNDGSQPQMLQVDQAGEYEFSGLVQGTVSYALSAFVDSNGNSSQDSGEPRASYEGNSFTIITNLIGADITIPANPAINSDLLGYWKLNETSGVLAADSSGNGRHGQVNGATWSVVDGRSCLLLDGVDDFMQVPFDSGLNTPALTLTGWIRHRDQVLHASIAAQGSRFRLSRNSNRLQGYVDGTNVNAVGGATTARDQWVHVALVLGPNKKQVFVNGVLRNNLSGVNLLSTTAPLVFGRWLDEAGWEFRGELAEMRLYGRELSEEEVAGAYSPGGISGSISYPGHLGWTLRVQAKAAGSTLEATIPASGQYQFADLLGGFAYAVTAFLDLNGNRLRDAWEPSGALTGNPIAINGVHLTNQDMTLTNPADTDNDGIADTYEAAHGLNVGTNDALLDFDNDGLSNLREYLAGLKANVGDSDGDAFVDALELEQNGTFAHSNDSDRDGMTDAFEFANNLNPLVNDAALDIDGDGLTNGEEFTAGLNPRSRDSNTDGTSDYAQVKGTKFNRYYYDRTNRLTGAVYDNGTWMGWKYDGNSNIARQTVYTGFDADNDGLPDVWELQNGFSFTSGTGSNGGSADNDNDGWSNAQEFLAGTNPNDPLSMPTVPAGAASYQSAPLVRLILPPASGGAYAQLKVRVWDNEANPAALTLQYFHTASSEWRTATLLKLDNQPVTPTTKAVSNATGTTHDLLWDALTDLGPTHNAISYLRIQGTDLNTGSISETVPYALNTTGDFDGDGIPDTYEIAHNLDPNDATGTHGASADTDNDGLNNFGEYVFVLNPNAADTTQPVTTAEAINPADGKRYLTLTYRRRIIPAGVAYAVETTSDLTTWTPNGPDIEPISISPAGDGLTELVTVRIKPPLEDEGAKKFVRVEVTAD